MQFLSLANSKVIGAERYLPTVRPTATAAFRYQAKSDGLRAKLLKSKTEDNILPRTKYTCYLTTKFGPCDYLKCSAEAFFASFLKIIFDFFVLLTGTL